MWPYRDWVIDAFNRNLPYDKFVITQLAGDLLPNSTFEDQIATSFHRQTPNNAEGGTDDEEFRLIAVMDRSATTWSALNGITMNCVQCHSHPYDPIRHAEYYKSLAFFNTQRDADLDDDSPNLRVPKDKARYAEASQIQQEIAKLLRSVVASDRRMEETAQWKPLPIEKADSERSAGFGRECAEIESDKIAKLPQKKMPPKQRADTAQRSARHRLLHYETALARAKAPGAPPKSFRDPQW